MLSTQLSEQITAQKVQSYEIDENRMGGCLFKGDLLLKNLKKKAIILMGNTRIGKSTLYNHFLNIPMKGVQGPRGVILAVIPQKCGAKMDCTRQSVTLVPNISTMRIEGQQVSLCDTAGFSDEARPYVGTFGVSYMLQKILQTVEEMKIILVVNNLIFQQDQLAKALEPFIKFIKILLTEDYKKQQLLNTKKQQTINKLFNSVSIVVTKVTNNKNIYIDMIHEFIQFIKNQIHNNSQQRNIVLKLLQNIFECKKLEVFKKAEINKELQKCVILQNLYQKKLKWDFYKKQANQKIFQLPFTEDKSNMKKGQLAKYLQQIEKKKKFVEDSLKLLKAFLHKAKQNWYQKTVKYDQQFLQIKTLIKDHPYGSQSGILNYLYYLGMKQISGNLNYSVVRLELFDLLKQIDNTTVKISQLVFKNTNQYQKQFTQLLNPQKKLYFNLFNFCKKMFCNSKQQQKDFITFMFMNLRSIQEYRMQFIIDRQPCSDIPKTIQQFITNLMPTRIHDLTGQFLVGFKPQPQQRQNYLNLLHLCVKQSISKISNKEVSKKIYYLSVTNKIKSAKIKIKSGKQKQGLLQLLQANENFQQYLKYLLTSPQPANKQKQTQQRNQFKQIHIFTEVAMCLQQMKHYHLALQLYQHMKSVHSFVRCYDKLIEGTQKKKQKIFHMQKFVKSLQKYGMNEKRTSLYKQMIDLAFPFPKKKEDYMEALGKLLETDPDTQQYQQQLRDKQDVQNNEQLFTKIKKYISQPSKINKNPPSQDEDLDDVFDKEYTQNTQSIVSSKISSSSTKFQDSKIF